ncbi:phosphatase PAP2 family protein, partial [Tepidimonas thermarum]|uniref:phosphatase PAP2 family protein n=1 Tax=Tepidimonas thermarum TaxID=335431 RepID=UPI00117EFBE6
MSSPPLVWRWCVAPAAVAAVLAASLRVGGYDVAALQATQRVTMGLPDTLWWLLTWLGDTQFALALLVLLVLLALPRSTPWLTALVWAALPTTVLVHGLKWAWHAPRPLAVLGPEGVHAIGTALLRNSFPSGHTAMAFLAAASIQASPGTSCRASSLVGSPWDSTTSTPTSDNTAPPSCRC